MGVGEVVLIVLPLPILLGCVVWFVKMLNTERSRTAVKWRGLSKGKRTLGLLLLAYMSFATYVLLANMLSLIGVASLPLGLLPSPILFWVDQAGVVGLAFLINFRSPRKPALSSGS